MSESVQVGQNGSTVEFVGGRPVEQTVAEEGGGVSANENRDAAIEAVKKAVGRAKEASKEVSPPKSSPEPNKPKEKEAKTADSDDEGDSPESEHEEKPKAEKTKDKGEEDKDVPALRRILKQKEKLAREKQEASENYKQEAEKLQQQYRQLQEYQKHLQDEAKRYERLRTNPVEAIKEFGWEPEQLVYDLANDGTPEGRQAQQLRLMQEQLRQQKEFQDNLIRQQQNQLQQQQEYQKQAYRGSIEQRFLKQAYGQGKEYTKLFYEGNEAALIARGDIIAAQARHLSGYEASPEEIADFIEQELAERANVVYDSVSKARQVRAAKEAESEENSEEVDEIEVTKPKAKKVGRTLGSDETKERRALSKKIEDLDDEERREEAKRAVKLVLSKQRKAGNDD